MGEPQAAGSGNYVGSTDPLLFILMWPGAELSSPVAPPGIHTWQLPCSEQQAAGSPAAVSVPQCCSRSYDVS